jgi:GPH family glycoside/pentoside/hexuronide:cation symporter
MDEIIEIPEEYVSPKTKINLSLGMLANGLLVGFVFGNLTFFYQVKLGLSAELLGIGWLIFAIWNTLNDPIASYLIDNTRTKIGRRIPYIRYGSFLYGLTFIFCWFPLAPLDNPILLFLNFLAALFLLDTMFTFVGACYFSLPNELAVTAKQRASINFYNAIAGIGNLVLGMILPVLLFTGHEGLPPYFGLAIIIIAVACTLTLFITSFYIKENMFAQMQEHESLIQGIKLTFKNKPFWILMIPMLCIYLVTTIVGTGLLYYIEFVLAGQSSIFFILSFLIGIFVGMILTIIVIPRWHPKKTAFINLIIISMGFGLLFFVGQSAILAAIPFLFVGLGYGGGMVAIPVMFGDTIDNDELITGKRREAVYGGVNALVNKPAISIANWIFLLTIASFGFDPNQKIQTEMAITGVLVAMGAIPAILVGVSAIVLYLLYPLDGPEWRKKKNYIIELHQQKEKEYLEKLVKDGKLKI